MGKSESGFIKFLEKYYENPEVAREQIASFKKLYKQLEDAYGMDLEKVCKDYSVEEVAEFENIAGPLLTMYDEWRQGTRDFGNEKYRKIITKESEQGIVPFARVKDIQIMEFLGDMLEEGSVPENRIYYMYDVPVEEHIPGLIPFIDKEIKMIKEYLKSIRITDTFEIWDDLEIVLSPYGYQKKYIKPFDPKDEDDLIRKYENAGVFAIPTEELKKARRTVTYSDIVDGKYEYSDGPSIIIFYRVLDISSTATYLADVRRVLAHEMFHAFHHRNALGTFGSHFEDAERVKEALADYFSYKYCIDRQFCIWGDKVFMHSKRCVRLRYLLWKKRENLYWPYSYALYLFPKNIIIDDRPDNGFEKFKEVFYKSRNDMQAAYEILISAEKEEEISSKVANTSPVKTDKSYYEILKSNLGRMEVMTMNKWDFDNKSDEYLDDYFTVENVNSKEDLLPVYLMNELKNNEGKKYYVRDLLKEMTDNPYRLEVDERVVERHLNTLASYYGGVWKVGKGAASQYLYSFNEPIGAEDPAEIKNTNKKENLVSLFITELLEKHKGELMGAVRIVELLDSEYGVSFGVNAVRRILNTIAVWDDKNIYSIQQGKKQLYMYEDENGFNEKYRADYITEQEAYDRLYNRNHKMKDFE